MSQIDLFEQPVDPPPQQETMIDVITQYVEFCKERREKALSKSVAEGKMTEERMFESLQEYQPKAWLVLAASRLPFLELATHTSKQNHPDSKATCLYVNQLKYQYNQTPLIGTDTNILATDVKCSAAYLPVFSFFKQSLEGETILDRVFRQDAVLLDAIKKICDDSAEVVWNSFLKFVTTPEKINADRMAKQVFFPVDTQKYRVLVVMYPSSLVQQAWQQIRDDRFGEHAKELREIRKQKQWSEYECHDYSNLLIHRYGGSNPQGISMLNVDRRGSMWLLPSLPPTWSSKAITLPKAGFFGKSLRFDDQVRPTLRALIDWYKQAYQPNNKPFRDERDRRLALLIDAVIDAALTVQSQAPVGWSATSQLSSAEKIWLDPQYMEQLGEQTELTTEQSALLVLSKRGDWQQQIALAFGAWLNTQLSKTLDDLDDAEQRVWAVYYFADNLKAMSTDLSGEMS